MFTNLAIERGPHIVENRAAGEKEALTKGLSLGTWGIADVHGSSGSSDLFKKNTIWLFNIAMENHHFLSSVNHQTFYGPWLPWLCYKLPDGIKTGSIVLGLLFWFQKESKKPWGPRSSCKMMHRKIHWLERAPQMKIQQKYRTHIV